METDRKWLNYYLKEDVVSMREHERGYSSALSYLEKKHPILSGSESRTFLLGGFFPYNSTKTDFVSFFSELRHGQHEKDNFVMLDFNKLPLEVAKAQDYKEDVRPNLVRADLTLLPFSGSIDAVILDHTVLFLPDEKLSTLSNSLSKALCPNGVVLVSTTEPLLPSRLSRFFGSRKHKTTAQPRKDSGIVDGLKEDLKLVYHGYAEYETRPRGDYSVLAFSRKDSLYQEFKGDPFALYLRP